MQINQLTLVILAAGMGSRYGGLKQMDIFSDDGDTITDLAIYDAVQAGFGKVVFVIRKSLEDDFKAFFSAKWSNKIKIEYAYQEIDTIPINKDVSYRQKPWGTGHALLCAKELVKENFVVINADDFYGREAFLQMATQLRKTNKDSFDFAMVGFPLENTLSENGLVSRGQCFVDDNGFLKNVIERTEIGIFDEKLQAKNENGDYFDIDPKTLVSMNFWGFTPRCFAFFEAYFIEFLNAQNGELKTEFFLPAVVNRMLQNNSASVQVIPSNAEWFGVTYQEDKKIVQQRVKALKQNNIYPKHLCR